MGVSVLLRLRRSPFSKIMIPKEMKYNLSSLCSTFRSPLSDSLYTDEYIDREGVDQPAQMNLFLCWSNMAYVSFSCVHIHINDPHYAKRALMHVGLCTDIV